MAAVSVFVDDAIRGTLPQVCAKTGEPADMTVLVRQRVGGGIPAVAWFLLFLGPLGIVGLALVALLLPGTEYLTVRLPETAASFSRGRQLERLRLAALGGGVAVLFLGVFRVGMLPRLSLAAAVALFVAAAAATVMLWRQSIGINIDASRRWVTLSGVHPTFARAVERQEAGLA